jgi:cytochrome c biogenesis protein
MRLDRTRPLPRGDQLARAADGALRLLADARLGVALLLLAALANAIAAALPDGPRLLASPPYVILLGVLLLTGLAAFALRAPSAWREWRRPSVVPETAAALTAEIPFDLDGAAVERVRGVVRDAGYRVSVAGRNARWSLHAVRRGWSRFAALGTHLAVVLLFVGAGVGTAFSSETVFSLLPGEQALLDSPRAGFTDAVRLESLDATFGADGRPLKLDTDVTFLRNGQEVERRTLQVNAPGEFGGYLVHGWTYGPAARVRAAALDGGVLLDATLPLDQEVGGRPAGSADLPLAGERVAAVLSDAASNELTVSVVGDRGVQDVAKLRPGQQRRIGSVNVSLEGFSSYVTFMSRRDPGMGLVFAGGALLSLALACAFWLPRRRLSVRPTDAGLRLTLRGERFDDPSSELAALAKRLQEVA